jgi:hypothetical protein
MKGERLQLNQGSHEADASRGSRLTKYVLGETPWKAFPEAVMDCLGVHFL